MTFQKRLRILTCGLAAAALFARAVAVPMGLLRERDASAAAEARALVEYVAAFDVPELREPLQDQETIGYVAETDVDTTRGGEVEMHYYLAQYALAPVLIEAGRPRHRLALANFSSPKGLRGFLASRDAEVIAGSGQGAALVRIPAP